MNTIATRLVPFILCGAFAAHAQDSRLGTYHAERSIDGSAQNALEVNQLTVTISRASGEALSTISKALPYDVGPPAVGVFESGSCVLLDGFHGILEFYDPSGRLERTINTVKDALPEPERVMPFAVHDFFITVAVSEPGLADIQLLRFTERGEPVFNARLSGEFASAVVISNSGTFAAVGTARWKDDALEHATFLVSASGEVESTLPIACSFGSFSPGDSLLLVASPDDFTLVSVAEGTVRSRSQVGPGRMTLDAAPQGGGFVGLSATNPVLQDGRWRYEDLRVERIEADGTRLAIPGDFQQAFGSARLKTVGGDVMLQIDGVVQPLR